MRIHPAIVLTIPGALALAGTAEAQQGIWTTPFSHTDVNVSGETDWGPALGPDGLELFFSSTREPVEQGFTGIFVARRESTETRTFSEVTYLQQVSSAAADDSNPNVADGGLTLYFSSDRAGGWGASDIWQATRPTLNDPFGAPFQGTVLEEINTPDFERDLTVTADGLVAVFQRGGDCCAGGDLYIASRAATDQPFANLRHLDELERGNSSEINPNLDELERGNSSEINPSLSSDGLALFFSEWGFDGDERRLDGQGSGDMWVARRESRDQRFGEPVNVGSPANGSTAEWSPFIFGNWPHEESTLYFARCGRGCRAENIQLFSSKWILLPPAKRRFVRGDTNGDEVLELTDAVLIVNVLFLGRGELDCADAADTNDDGGIDVTDTIYSLNRLFLGGESFPAPRDRCGPDLTQDNLVCESFPPCGG